MTITTVKAVPNGYLVNDLEFVPDNSSNRTYQDILDFINEGGTVLGQTVIDPDYKVLRKAAYPPLEVQLDMQYWDGVNGTTTWADTIEAIKTQYPTTITGGTSTEAVPQKLLDEAAAKLAHSQKLAYEVALERLSRYRLAEGRAEIVESQPTGEQVLDDTTGDLVDVMHDVVVQTAIEPLPATIDSTSIDTDGNPTIVEQVPNPLIVQDDAERAQAQAVIDATPISIKGA